MASFLDKYKRVDINEKKDKEAKSIEKSRDLLNEYDPNQNTFTQAISNLDESGKQLVNDIITPFLNPAQTAKDLYSLSKSVVSLIPGIEGDDTQARAVGKFFKDRYGSLENIKKTFATDPVGMLSDVSIIFSGGAMLPGKVGKVSKIASKVDPVNLVGYGVNKASQGAGAIIKPTLGMVTGAGEEAITTAIKAGQDSGPKGLIGLNKSQKQSDFIKNLTGKEEILNIVEDVQGEFGNLVKNKRDAYNTDIAKLELDKQKIDFKDIQDEILKYAESKVAIYEKNPALHNAKGMDMLKQKINDMWQPTGPRGAKDVVIQTRTIIENSISNKVPGYKKVMKDYKVASKLEDELKDALSLGNNAKASTTLKKLQSTLKNNTTTNLGQRRQSLSKIPGLENKNVIERLAGQALSSRVPRGVQMVGATGAGLLGLGGVGANLINPLALGGLLSTSPRLVGRVANTYGKLQPAITPTLRASRVAGTLGANRGIYENQRGLL
jgi:hypothetical protein